LSHHFVAHHLSSTSSFVFPSIPVPAATFLANYWKKLTCGAFRSFFYVSHRRWIGAMHSWCRPAPCFHGPSHELCKVLRCFPFAFSGVWCFGFLPCCVFIHLLGPRLPHCGNWCSPHLCPLQPGHCGLLHQQASPYSTCRFVSRGQRLRMFGTLVTASLKWS
jgi:hypothetical protein